MPHSFSVTALVMSVAFASATTVAASDVAPPTVAPVAQGTVASSAQSVRDVAQQTRQQAALQATLAKIQSAQASVTVTALQARAARDSAVASSL